MSHLPVARSKYSNEYTVVFCMCPNLAPLPATGAMGRSTYKCNFVGVRLHIRRVCGTILSTRPASALVRNPVHTFLPRGPFSPLAWQQRLQATLTEGEVVE